MSTQPTQSDSLDEREKAVHLSHCNQGEYMNSCKYGEFDTCPALYAPKQDDIAKLNKMVHPELDGACAICGINPIELAAHYAAKEQEAVLRAKIDELEGLSVGVDDMCAEEWHERLTDLTNQLNQMKGDS